MLYIKVCFRVSESTTTYVKEFISSDIIWVESVGTENKFEDEKKKNPDMWT